MRIDSKTKFGVKHTFIQWKRGIKNLEDKNMVQCFRDKTRECDKGCIAFIDDGSRFTKERCLILLSMATSADIEYVLDDQETKI